MVYFQALALQNKCELLFPLRAFLMQTNKNKICYEVLLMVMYFFDLLTLIGSCREIENLD